MFTIKLFQFYSKIEDYVTYMYFIYAIMHITASIGVVIWMILLILKEIKENFIDVLRMNQYIFILLWFLHAIFEILWSFWYKHTDDLGITIIIEVFDGLMLYYYILNLLAWYLLMNKIIVLHKLRSGINYDVWRKQIKSVELKVLLYFVLFIILHMIYKVTYHLLSKHILYSTNIKFNAYY